MKILKIYINNIASLVDVTIDFTTGSLSQNSIFLICGETGSGKSTILNSICIALYDRVPALDAVNATNDGKDIDNVGVKTPYQLVRRECKNASIILDFEGIDGNVYQVVWSVARHRKRTDNTIEDKRTWTIACPKKNTFYEKNKDVKEEIIRVVGFTFEQFCRTTMLAQGQFLKFLNSDRKEKCEILEKLTGTELYAEIGKNVYLKFKASKDLCDRYESKIKDADLFDDERIHEENDKIEESKRQIVSLSEHLKAVTSWVNWLKQYTQRTHDLEGLRADLNRLLSEESQQRVQCYAQIVDMWDKTVDIRNIIAQGANAYAGINAANKDLADIKPQCVEMAQAFIWLQGDIVRINSEIKAKEEALAKHEQNLAAYEASAKVFSLIDAINENKRKVKKAEEDIKAIKKALQDLQPVIDQQNSELVSLEKDLADKQSAVNQSKKALEDVDQKALAQQLEAVNNQINDINKLKSLLGVIADKVSDVETKRAAVAELKANLQGCESKLELARDSESKLKSEYDQAKSRLEGMMDLSQKLSQLTSVFAQEHKCPLCGSDVEHLHPQSVLSQEVQNAQAGVVSLKKECDEAQKTVSQLVADIKSYKKSIADANRQIESVESDIKSKKVDAQAIADKLSLDISADDYIEAVNSLLAQKESNKASLKQQSDHALELQDKYNKANDERDKAQRLLDKKKKEAQETKDKAQNLTSSLAVKNTIISQAQESINQDFVNVAESLKDSVGLLPVHDCSLDDIDEIASALHKAVDDYKGLMEGKRSLVDAKNDSSLVLQGCMSDFNSICKVFALQPQDIEAKQMRGFNSRMHSLALQCVQYDAKLKEYTEKRAEARAKEDEYFASHDREAVMAQVEMLAQESAQSIKDKREDIAKHSRDVDEKKGSIKLVEEDIQKLQSDKPADLEPEMTLEQANEALTDVQQKLDGAKEQKTTSETVLSENRKREESLKQTRELLKQETVIRDKWAILNSLFGKVDGSQFREYAQCYIFIQLLNLANEYLSRLSNRYRLEGHYGSFLIYVVDRYEGNAKRLANSLSGGEGFIASLSLALALSTINKNVEQVDTLFIDEGFGSLSADVLKTVVDMLDNLHSESGRRVGIISHIEYLTENIPTQIRVKKSPGSSQSSIEIV